MPDPLFASLCRDTENLTWAPTQEVRRRGRQRTRRTQIAASLLGVAAMSVVATGAAVLAARPHGTPPNPLATGSPTPSPTPSPAPSPTSPLSPTAGAGRSDGPPVSPSRRASSTAIPAAATLQLADLPKGFRFAGDDLDGDWSLEAMTIYCSNRSPSITPGTVAQRGAVFESRPANVIQRVTRHSGDNAATSMDRVRETVTGCRPARAGLFSWTVVADGLGGDESLLVESRNEGGRSQWLVVRQGDLVAQVFFRTARSVAEARRYAQSVAARLCAGTDAC